LHFLFTLICSRVVIFITSLFYFLFCGLLLWLAMSVKNSSLWEQLNETAGFDITLITYSVGIVGGCVCLLLAISGICSACYKYRGCYITFGIFSFLLAGGLLSLGLSI